MAKNYGKKKSVRRNNSGILSQLLLVGIAFLFGYGSASIFDYAQVGTWINTHVLAQKSPNQNVKEVAQSALPKPKFEFYTLLANGTGPAQTAPVSRPAATPPTSPSIAQQPSSSTTMQSAPVVAANASPATPTAPINLTVTRKLPAPFESEIKVASTAPTVVKGSGYLVQVASFRNFREADHMKGSLAMKGFVVKIVTANQQNVNWYRVIIGPFASRAQAQKAQLAFARTEHIMGMIRKMDA